MTPDTGPLGGEPGRSGTMTVALRLAWRQARGGRRHLAALFACVALGVGALVAVGTLGAGLEATLAREAKALLGGDVELRAARPLPADADAALARLAGAGARVVHVRELAGMARAPARGATVLVELKAPSPGYPLYGALVTTPAAPLSSLLADDGAVVERELLDRLGLAIGERLTIGETSLTIRAVLGAEPDRAASLVRLGPRVFLSPAALERARLVSFGSRVRYRALLRLPDGLAAGDTRAELARAIVDPGVRVAAYDEAQPGLRRASTEWVVRASAFESGQPVIVSLNFNSPPQVVPAQTFTRAVRVTPSAGTFQLNINQLFPGAFRLGLYNVQVKGPGGREASTTFMVIPG